MNTPANDRDNETLCALFDGELEGDAARFALKRLGHDAQWRQACDRWQLYGDVLRGQATAFAGNGFSERVATAVAREPSLIAVASNATASTASRSPRSAAASRRGWIGGALAASVAVAALFVSRPFSNDAAPAVGDAATTQVAATTPAPARPALQTPEPALPDAPDHQAGLSAAAVAAVEVPRRAAERRSSTRSQSQRAALRASRQTPVAATAVASVAPAAALASVSSDAVATNPVASKPFQPEHAEATARPWPRAVLPQYSGSAGITASYGSGASSPSFYPFEPSLAPTAEQTAADSESSAPRR